MVCLTSCGSQGLPVYTVGARGWHPDRGLSLFTPTGTGSRPTLHGKALATTAAVAPMCTLPRQDWLVCQRSPASAALRTAPHTMHMRAEESAVDPASPGAACADQHPRRCPFRLGG